jgi:hypothetical protein
MEKKEDHGSIMVNCKENGNNTSKRNTPFSTTMRLEDSFPFSSKRFSKTGITILDSILPGLSFLNLWFISSCNDYRLQYIKRERRFDHRRPTTTNPSKEV